MLTDVKVKVLEWSSQSPDLNPVKNLPQNLPFGPQHNSKTGPDQPPMQCLAPSLHTPGSGQYCTVRAYIYLAVYFICNEFLLTTLKVPVNYFYITVFCLNATELKVDSSCIMTIQRYEL